MTERSEGIGEGGIRTHHDSLDSVSCRFYIAAVAVNARDAVAPCTRLHPTEERSFFVANHRFRTPRLRTSLTLSTVLAKNRATCLNSSAFVRCSGGETFRGIIFKEDCRVHADPSPGLASITLGTARTIRRSIRERAAVTAIAASSNGVPSSDTEEPSQRRCL
jgi:hypothetical protein